MNITELCKLAHKNSVDKGFWDNPTEIGTYLMLIVTEVAEALEYERTHSNLITDFNGIEFVKNDKDFKHLFESNIKDTFGDELADAVIRIADLSKGLNIDLEKHIELKMKYNKMREYKHGKKY